MTEKEAHDDLYARGVWQLAPGLWCDKQAFEMIPADDAMDNAIAIRAWLVSRNELPPLMDE